MPQVSGTGGPKWTLPLNGLTHPRCLTSFQVTCGLQLIGQLDILGDLMTASSYKQKVYYTGFLTDGLNVSQSNDLKALMSYYLFSFCNFCCSNYLRLTFKGFCYYNFS